MNDISGSQWRRWDLHFHTPKSFDYKNKGLSVANLVNGLTSAGVRVVAVTDHHVLDAQFIGEMQKAGAGRLTVLPGIELSSNLGGDEGVHFIAIFAEDSDLTHLSNELTAKLDLARKRKEGVIDEKLYVDFPQAAQVIQDLNGLITIHGHGKASNYETISSRLKFKQQQKTDLLRDCVDIIEVGGEDHQTDYLQKIFPIIKFELPLIVGSDNHNATQYTPSAPCWIKADPTFAGLRMALRQPRHRFFIGTVPPSLDRFHKNKIRYIKSISFKKTADMPTGEEWLTGEIPLNPGLVAIIGNKGSGKSALADCIGLLGSCTTSDAFSFLETERFRNPKTGRAQYIHATMAWHDGPAMTKRLDEPVKDDEPERLKYLPQSFVEKVCNELSTPGVGAFERELKKVIFSKIGQPDRLGKHSLDELVIFRTQEIRKAADAFAIGLKDLGIKRALLEERLDPQVKTAIEKRIKQRQEEIKSHEATKPPTKTKPDEKAEAGPDTKASLDRLAKIKADLQTLKDNIKAAQAVVVAQQLRAATAKKLFDKIQNLRTEVARQTVDMTQECLALGLDVSQLVVLKLDDGAVRAIRDEALGRRDAAQLALNGPTPPGMIAQQTALEAQIKDVQSNLDKPQQEYQLYLTQLAKWQAISVQLKESVEDPNSLKGLEADLAALATVPVQLAEVDSSQIEVAAKIHALRIQEASVYTELYGPVQKFIATHRLAKEQLKLEFKVELVQEDFAESLLRHLNQQRSGSFSGLDEGRALAMSLTAPVNWSANDSVKQFLQTIVEHLHTDKRAGYGTAVFLKNQIGKGKSAADLYAWLYSLDYLKPRYLLRWEDKDVSQLSPGERGTLLLIFYLLVDDSDVPLVIDQPEANLDNLTVAQKLVHCIRDARERRQVIIVTHNPNLAVVCDADQLVHASLDKSAGNKIPYTSGALEHPRLNHFAIDVLEGSRGPFDMRDATYDVMGE